MKKLIFMLCIIMATLHPIAALSDEYDKEWSPGDTIITASICKSEEIILEIARNDTISEEAALNTIKAFTLAEDCLTILPPIPFYVHSIVVDYKDFKKRPSVVLALRMIGDKYQNIVGYALAAGRLGSI